MRLERLDAKVSRAVLRGEGQGNLISLTRQPLPTSFDRTPPSHSKQNHKRL